MSTETQVVWYKTLSPELREKLFEEMRRIGDEVLHLWQEHHALAPPTGTIAVGGAHMDSLFKAEAMSGFLYGLREGADIETARGIGVEQSRAAVAKWNAKREYQVHRWEDTAVAYLDGVMRCVLDCTRVQATKEEE